MPNPFMRLGTPNQGTDQNIADSDKHPYGQAPVLEHIKGHNNPYRGVESHGVVPNNDPTPVPGNTEGVDTVFISEEPDPAPVPVRIVQESSNAQKRFRVLRGITNTSISAVTVPNIVIGENRSRRKMLIFNLGTVTLYIAAEQMNASASNGYPILANTSIDLSNSPDSAVWVSSADGTAQPYAVLIEYETEIN